MERLRPPHRPLPNPDRDFRGLARAGREKSRPTASLHVERDDVAGRREPSSLKLARELGDHVPPLGARGTVERPCEHGFYLVKRT